MTETALISPFTTVMNLLRAAALIQDRFRISHGVSLNEAILLMYLERAPQQRLTRVDLAKRMHLSPSTVTRMAAPMEKIGLVSRQSDARDARRAYVVLSEAGRATIGEVRETLTQSSADLLSDRWTDSEIDTLGRLLGRLTAAEPGLLV